MAILFAVIFVLIHSLSFFYNQYNHYTCSPILKRKSLSLPDIEGEYFAGRETEMNIIIDYIDNPEIKVVTLFGLAGLGKSALAQHVGHRMLEQGLDVHYIKVEEIADVKNLEQQLMDVTDTNFAGARLTKWAMDRRTLLILDNVDGHWLGKKLRQQFQTSFVQKLLQYSSLLELLITSQQKIEFHDKNFQFYELHSLSVRNCVQLTLLMAPGSNTTECETLCKLIGSVPMAVKVLTSLLKPDVSKSGVYSMSDVILRLQEDRFQIIENAGNRVKERIVSALKLAYNSLEQEYQVCSLLLAKSRHMPEDIFRLISETMEDLGFKRFHVKDCLYELNSKSLLEHSTSRYRNYSFHILVSDFLKSSMAKDTHNMTWLLNSFWNVQLQESCRDGLYTEEDTLFCVSYRKGALLTFKTIGRDYNRKFSYWQEDIISGIMGCLDLDITGCLNKHASQTFSGVMGMFLHFFLDFRWTLEYRFSMKSLNKPGMEDIEALVRILEQGFSAGKSTAMRICGYYFVILNLSYHGCDSVSKRDSVSKHDCLLGIEDLLSLAEARVEKLQLLAEGDRKIGRASAVFHTLLWHLQTRSAWKSSLFLSVYALVITRDSCIRHCVDIDKTVQFPGCRDDRHSSKAVLGLEFYSLMEDDKASDCLHLALQENYNSHFRCRELHDAIVYIALYDIYSRHDNQAGMKETRDGVVASIQLADEVCFDLTTYNSTILPFLQYTDGNDTTLHGYMDFDRNFCTLMCHGWPFNCCADIKLIPLLIC